MEWSFNDVNIFDNNVDLEIRNERCCLVAKIGVDAAENEPRKDAGT